MLRTLTLMIGERAEPNKLSIDTRIASTPILRGIFPPSMGEIFESPASSDDVKHPIISLLIAQLAQGYAEDRAVVAIHQRSERVLVASLQGEEEFEIGGLGVDRHSFMRSVCVSQPRRGREKTQG